MALLRSVQDQQTLLLSCGTASSECVVHSVLQNTHPISIISVDKWEVPRCIVGKADHVKHLQFREKALVTLLSMLGEDVARYRQESAQLDHLTSKLTNGMPVRSHMDATMGTDVKGVQHSTELEKGQVVRVTKGLTEERHRNDTGETQKRHRRDRKEPTKTSSLTRTGSVKYLIHKFSISSGDGSTPFTTSPKLSSPAVAEDGSEVTRGRVGDTEARELLHAVPVVTVMPPSRECHGDRVVPTVGSAQGVLPNGHAPQPTLDVQLVADSQEGPESEEESLTPKATTPSTKYGFFLSDVHGNGASGPGGPNSPVASSNGTKSSLSHWRSMETLMPTDWDSNSSRTARVESPLRTFNSPYATLSLDYNPGNRMSDYKVPDRMSPVTPDYNMFGLSRNISSKVSPVVAAPRSRISTYDTLTRRREQQAAQAHPLLRNNMPTKRDYIEEMTRQLDDCQRRNQFLEAESVELEKERAQIRFEMRGLLVNNEDLMRMNTQMQAEVKRMRDVIVELESNNNVMVERFKKMEVELKEAREAMVEANTQEYAFNFLQQSLKNKIQDAEDSLEKQTQHVQELSEKLWLAERKLEELEMEKESKGKKTVELNSSVLRLETELADALQRASQSGAELNLQQKLRVDTQMRVEELEENVLEKDQEIIHLHQIISRLQGEVSDKLLDKEQCLEEEIQLRERAQLQCKQSERLVEDLQLELQTATQAREDLTKQLKQTQEKLIDMETDLEEIQENEQRSSSKHKKALEQYEQIQLKLIQEKDLNDKLECEKLILERQVREFRSEIEELQTNRVQEHVVTKTEMRARELENALRVEERNKLVLNNTIAKLERKVNELSEQLEEEQKMNHEQKDLMTQRLRSLKRQLNEAEEEVSRRESQQRLLQRELGEERECSERLQRQLDLQLLNKRKDTLKVRQTLDSLKLDLSDEEEEDEDKSTTYTLADN